PGYRTAEQPAVSVGANANAGTPHLPRPPARAGAEPQRGRRRVPAHGGVAAGGSVHAGRGGAGAGQEGRAGPHRRQRRVFSQLTGSRAMPPWPRISKCRWGPWSLDPPPTWPTICPLITRSPWVTVASLR